VPSLRILLVNPSMNMQKLGRFADLLEPMPPTGIAVAPASAAAAKSSTGGAASTAARTMPTTIRAWIGAAILSTRRWPCRSIRPASHGESTAELSPKVPATAPPSA